jgi:hypothetical protein
MTAPLLLFLWCVSGPEPGPGGPADPAKRPEAVKRIEAARARWNQLSPPERSRLQRAYRELTTRVPHATVERWKGLDRHGTRPQLQNFPPHWRAFLVANARWARGEIAKLPEKDRKELMSLPPAARAAAIKERLKPHFQRHLAECRAAAAQAFSPLELRVLGELPPRERAAAVRQSEHDAFGLISPWSWRRYREMGSRKSLVNEYLNMPDALVGSQLVPKPAAAH